MTLRIWPRVSADGARNMAFDEAAMECARTGDFVFRVYGWAPSCISLGRNQPTTASLNGRPIAGLVCGVDVVRRPTGGRSVFHGPEITYAFAAPERSLGGPRAIYRGVHGALRAALRAEGVEIDDPLGGEGVESTVRLDLEECFVSPAPGEITVGGRKLVGSAQWRHRGAILQHGSVLLSNHQNRATADGDGGSRAIGLDELGWDPIDQGAGERLGNAFVEAIENMTSRNGEAGPPPPVAEELAATMEAGYREEEWTWRK